MTSEAACVVAEKFIAALHQPLQLASQRLETTASIGIAMHAADDPDGASELMKKADIAMYAAKHAGRDTYRVYEAGLA
ncbi:MAG: diguanylate cyclase domain-containing protein [Bacteroidota bacterium]